MHRFFLKPEQIGNKQVFFQPEEVNQIKNVLRLSSGDCIYVLDNNGNLYTVELSKSRNQTLIGNIIKMQSCKTDSGFSTSLGQVLTKGPKIEFIIQKATELGIRDISFFETERSILKYKNIKEKNRLTRWQKIAKEAAEQSCRVKVPNISCCQNLTEFCQSQRHAGLKLIFWEKEMKKKLRDYFKSDIDISHLALIIGPEGGFSKKEIDTASRFGFRSVGLGSRILKTETAVISILSIIQHLRGELG